jgi:hypothetical protein
MIDDNEGEVQEAPAEAPAAADPAEELSSDIRDAVRTQRERGADGKFKASDAAAPRGAAKGTATGGPASAPAEPAPKAPKEGERPGNRAPHGFSVASKQAWDALPEHVKADIASHEARRDAEHQAGLQRYSGLTRFAEEAERNGTTIQAAVNDYVAVEAELRKDFVGGVEFLCRRLGVQPQALLAAMAQKYLPAGQGQPQPQPQYQPQYDPNAIANHAANMVRGEMQMRDINSQIEVFAADPANKFFDNVRQDMAILVQAGKAADIRTAYEAACWLDPQIRAILLEESRAGTNRTATMAASRAQNAAKAIAGAPTNSHAGEAPRPRNLSLDETIRAAVREQKGNA